MPNATETGARRLVDELYRATDGRLRQMRSLQLIADARAVYHAVKAGWVEVSPANDPHSIALTEEGRQLK